MHVLEESFRILRVTIESRTTVPTTIAVSSAQRGDGATYVACGLGRAFAESGRTTLLVDANAGRSGIARELGTRVIPRASRNALGLVAPVDGIDNLYVASLPARADVKAGSKLALHDLLAELRAEFGAIVVDAPPVPSSGEALDVARCADELFLAIRLGRKPGAADREAIKLLAESNTRIAGVVPTHAGLRRLQQVQPPADVLAATPATLIATRSHTPPELEVS